MILPTPSRALELARILGWRGVLRRSAYVLRRKSGLIRLQLPAAGWDERPLARWLRPKVPFDASAYFAWREQHAPKVLFAELDADSSERLLALSPSVPEADGALAGRWRFFSHREFELGFPPDWHVDPFANVRAPAEQHWSQVSDSAGGDIKLVWELSRFAFAYALVRAWARTRGERYAEAFWSALEDWAARNPPHTGPNWGCGQETSLRIMALCFALYGLREAAATTAERVSLLALMLARMAARVQSTLGYALSQHNNHALSEAAGLFTVGTLFPEFARASAWRTQGKRILEQEVPRQVHEDGSYIQNSTNYHRLMLHDLLWAVRLGEVHGDRFSDNIYRRISGAVDFLRAVTDAASGRAPNWGANDGALVLPLSGCDCTDFRPALQAAHYLVHRRRLFPPGPWDEDLLWLFGPQALADPTANARKTGAEQRNLIAFPEGGYHVMRGPRSWAAFRCGQHQSRPGHADQLHLDLWWNGVNVAGDAGTYLYSGAPPWNNSLARTLMHNTVTVEGRDQMTRAGRFLWLDWAHASMQRWETAGEFVYLEAEHDGYRRLGIIHRRAVAHVGGDHWMVVDDVLGTRAVRLELHWLLPDAAYQTHLGDDGALTLRAAAAGGSIRVACNTSFRWSLIRAGAPVAGNDPSSAGAASTAIRGWRSLYYADRQPACSLVAASAGPLPARFVTVFTPQDALTVHTDARRGVRLSKPGQSPIMQPHSDLSRQ